MGNEVIEQVAGKTPTLPILVLARLDSRYGQWDSTHALARLRADGLDEQIPSWAAALSRACAPCDPEALKRRLTALGMTMAPNRPSAEATMWLHEMTRLLRDLAQDVLFEAIDQCQRASKFLPTVAEIRLIADPVMEERRQQAARLEAMARLIASGAAIPDLRRPSPPEPPAEPVTPMTAADHEEMNNILASIGALTRYRPDGSRYEVADKSSPRRQLGPLRKPTRQDYIEMGVDPAVLDGIGAA